MNALTRSYKSYLGTFDKIIMDNGEGVVINFGSVDVSIGESTTKWLYALMSHTLVLSLNVTINRFPNYIHMSNFFQNINIIFY